MSTDDVFSSPPWAFISSRLGSDRGFKAALSFLTWRFLLRSILSDSDLPYDLTPASEPISLQRVYSKVNTASLRDPLYPSPPY
jgi:hypothetical protein